MSFLLKEKERSSSRFAALHCWCYRIALRKINFACVLRHLPLLTLPFSAPGRGRTRPSRAFVALTNSNIPIQQKKKADIMSAFFFVKGQRKGYKILMGSFCKTGSLVNIHRYQDLYYPNQRLASYTNPYFVLSFRKRFGMEIND